MTAVVDTSVLIDYLRGHQGAAALLESERSLAPLHASEMTRLEILAGMRASEATGTDLLLSTLIWHPVDENVARRAGAFGRTYLRGDGGIDSADLAIAAITAGLQARLLTRNVRHFPMFPGLHSPYE